VTIFGRQPAFWIGLIITLILGAARTLAGEGLISDGLEGQLTSALQAIGQLAELVAPLIATMIVARGVTPVAAPKLPAGTSVMIEGTDATQTIGPAG
jgi:hypothetical protein